MRCSRLQRVAKYLITFFFMQSVFAWDATGHRIISQIALDHLTPHAKVRFLSDNRALSQTGKSLTWQNAAVWLDKLQTPTLKPLHYIDLPYTEDGSVLPEVSHRNAVIAIQEAKQTYITCPIQSKKKRGFALRTLLHVVADLHQPLHTITRVSHVLPAGDKGGNLTTLPDNPVSKNLHRYWDQGAGLLVSRMSESQVKQLAKQIEARWPCGALTPEILTPMSWAKESHQLAISSAYAFNPAEKTLDAQYQRNAQQLVEKRIALAGCRLSGLLNWIDENAC